MIIIQLAGGLGNQLFIWAATLSPNQDKKSQKIILTHDSKHGVKTQNIQDLEKFILFSKSNVKLIKLEFLGQSLRLLDFIEKIYPGLNSIIGKFLRVNTFEDAFSSFSPQSLGWKINRGYFQRFNENQIRTAIPLLNSYLQEVAINSDVFNRHKILNEKYQVIHIRRGDYSESKFGLLHFSFYFHSLAENLPLVVCTDDTSLASEIESYFQPEVIFSPDNSSAWESIAVISNASYIIGSNSTFSWWASVVGASRGATVIAPEPWFQDLSCPPYNFCRLGILGSTAIFETSED